MVSRDDGPWAAGPVRTCIGCRRRTAKRELLRLVAGADSDGSWSVLPDPSGTAPGRGAYLHPTVECLALAERRRVFARALRHDAVVSGTLSLDGVRDHLVAAGCDSERGPDSPGASRRTDKKRSTCS